MNYAEPHRSGTFYEKPWSMREIVKGSEPARKPRILTISHLFDPTVAKDHFRHVIGPAEGSVSHVYIIAVCDSGKNQYLQVCVGDGPIR